MMMNLTKTTAAILVAQNQPLVVDQIELPSSLDVGQVLIEVTYSSICGSQLGEISGLKGPDPYLPHLLGHEGSGIVLETGPGVTTIEEGDHVVLHWRPGSGIQGIPPKYQWRGRVLNAGFVTTFNQHAIISENRLTAIPKDFPMDLAPLFGCAVTTGLGIVENNAKLRMGESIVVVGAGGVGLNVLQGARLHTAYPIVAIDHFDNRLRLAADIGATHTINNSIDIAWVDTVRQIVGEGGADVVVDNTGNAEIIACCIQLTAAQGRTILVGVPVKGEEVSLYTLPLHFGKVLTGSHGGNGNPAADLIRYIRLNRVGKLDLTRLITATYKLPEINDAIGDMKDGTLSGRCVISCN